MVGVGIKNQNRSFFSHKMALDIIVFTIAHAKWPKLFTGFAKTLNSTLLPKQNSF